MIKLKQVKQHCLKDACNHQPGVPYNIQQRKVAITVLENYCNLPQLFYWRRLSFYPLSSNVFLKHIWLQLSRISKSSPLQRDEKFANVPQVSDWYRYWREAIMILGYECIWLTSRWQWHCTEHASIHNMCTCTCAYSLSYNIHWFQTHRTQFSNKKTHITILKNNDRLTYIWTYNVLTKNTCTYTFLCLMDALCQTSWSS